MTSKIDSLRVDYGKDNLNELIERLRKRLPEYLKMRGVISDAFPIDGKDHFKCISPVHPDKNPSMSFIPASNGTMVRCFSCGVAADIFKAVSFLEDKPLEGPEWVQENVYYIARELNEDFQEFIPSEVDMRKAKVLKMLADAADVFYGLCKKTASDPNAKYNPFEYTRKRHFKDEFCLEWGVGTVDYNDFIFHLERYGPWDRTFCESHGVNSSYFGLEFVTFVLRDHKGVVVGFDRRFTEYDPKNEAANKAIGKPYPKKYMLPSTSEVFDKGHFIYGLYNAKKEAYKGLDIVEGYFDALAGIQAGYRRMIAASGTNGIQPSSIALLKSVDVSSLAIVMDSDTAGKNACKKYLKEYAGDQEMRIGFRFLDWKPEDAVPEKERDPFTFFTMYCKKSIDPYLAYPVISSFRVNLDIETEKGAQGEQLARAQIPHIASEPDIFKRGNMIKELATITGVADVDIRAAVDDIITGKARNIVRDLVRDLQNSPCAPRDVSEIVTRATNKLGPLFGGSAQVVTKQAAQANFHEAIDTFDNDRGAIAGYRTGIPMLDNNMGGIQKGIFCAIAGNPNSGKSAFTYFLMNGLLNHYAENKDLMILGFSFDDTVNWTYAKLIACRSGFPIKWCARPQFYLSQNTENMKRYLEARAFIQDKVGDCLRIFGGDIGMNMSQIKKAIKNAQESTGKHCLVVVDSFNKMQGDAGMEGVAKFEKNANDLHELIHNGHSVITTCEMVKDAQGTRPQMRNMKDTSKVGYNANAVMIVYNPLHELRDKSPYFHVTEDPDKPGVHKKSAVVQIEMVKNRLSDYKGEEVYRFYDNIGSFEPIPNIHEFMNEQREKWNQQGHDNHLEEGKVKTPKSYRSHMSI